MSLRYKTNNSFTRTPAITQIFTYIIVTLQTIVFYLMIRPNFSTEVVMIVYTTLFSISLCVQIGVTIACSWIDPSDNVMINYINNGRKRNTQGAISYNYMYYCQICNSYVQKQSKHCRQCNRCVQNFDHHCIWINNCIGSKNYKIFISMIISTQINLSIFLSAVIHLTIQKNWLNFVSFMITVWVIMGILSILWFLLFNLNLLHLYLTCKGYTTYEFIMIRKQQEKKQQIERLEKEAKIKEENLKQMIEKSNKNMFNISGLENCQVNHSQGNVASPDLHSSSKQKVRKVNNNRVKKVQQKHRQGDSSTIEFIKLPNQKGIKQIDQLQATAVLKKKQDYNEKYHFLNSQMKNKNDKSQSDSIFYIQKQKIYPMKDGEEFIEDSSDYSSINMSTFFTKNKSFNLLISKQIPNTPKKISTSRQLTSHSKTKSKKFLQKVNNQFNNEFKRNKEKGKNNKKSQK